jgi:pimeloyl-ACP methyl ester carboxylesterase
MRAIARCLSPTDAGVDATDVNTRRVTDVSQAAALRTLARYGVRPAAFHNLADRVSCPVLLLHGDEDHYVPPAFALAAADRHPQWEFSLIPGAGHLPHRDNPANWLASVDPWLRRPSAGIARQPRR